MKNFKTALILLFAVVIVILVFFLVKKINNNNNSNNSKIISEIKYMDNKLMTLLNSMNGLSLENYKVSVTKTSTDLKKQNNGSEEENTTSGGQEGGNSESKSSNSSSSNTISEQYSLKDERVLTSNKETDWETIKNEIEILYSTVPTMTLDLYSSNVNQQEILNFNKELDELTIAVKEEDKEKTLIKLANLYRYLPAYAKNFTDDSDYVGILETKSNVFNSYVFADQEDWEKVIDYTNKAIDSYLPVLNNLKENGNQYDSQKIYIILNELQSAANLKDKNVFLIKYKNFLEETQKKNQK